MLRYTLFGVLSSFVSMSTFVILVYKGTFPSIKGQIISVTNDTGVPSNLSVIIGTDWNNILYAGGIATIIGTVLSAGLIAIFSPIVKKLFLLRKLNKKFKEQIIEPDVNNPILNVVDRAA